MEFSRAGTCADVHGESDCFHYVRNGQEDLTEEEIRDAVGEIVNMVVET